LSRGEFIEQQHFFHLQRLLLKAGDQGPGGEYIRQEVTTMAISVVPIAAVVILVIVVVVLVFFFSQGRK